MTLRLNGSTSGYVEIDAPATAGSNTLVLPTGNGSNGQYLQTNGSGGLSWAGAGKILQVVHGSNTFTASISTASNSYVDTGIFDVSITPVAASSKIIVSFAGYHPHINAYNGNYGGAFKIYRGINGSWSDASTNHIEGYYNMAGGAGEWFDYSGRSQIVDSPAYTLGSSIGYRLYVRKASSNTSNFFAHHTGGIVSFADAAQVTYFLMEVAA
jgi:hypothetical protein